MSSEANASSKVEGGGHLICGYKRYRYLIRFILQDLGYAHTCRVLLLVHGKICTNCCGFCHLVQIFSCGPDAFERTITAETMGCGYMMLQSGHCPTQFFENFRN